jgi:hypothetical protein
MQRIESVASIRDGLFVPMDITVFVLIGTWLAIAVGGLRLYPELLAPHCPICGQILEASGQDRRWVANVRNWHLRWEMFDCTLCLYNRRLLSVTRRSDVEHP